MISLFLFFTLFWEWSVGVVRGPVRIGSLWNQSVLGVRGPGVSVFALPGRAKASSRLTSVFRLKCPSHAMVKIADI